MTTTMRRGLSLVGLSLLMGATFAIKDADAATIGFGPIGISIPGVGIHPGYPGRRPHAVRSGHSQPDGGKGSEGDKSADGGKGSDTGKGPDAGKGSEVAKLPDKGSEAHGPDLTPEE